MLELEIVQGSGTPAPVFMVYFDRDRLDDYLRLATFLRSAGIGVELYDKPKKLGEQLKYADRRGHRLAVIAGSREFDAGACQVKDMGSGEKREVALDDGAASLVEAIRDLLGGKELSERD